MYSLELHIISMERIFLGNSIIKLVDSSTTDVQNFNSIQSALNEAATNSVM